MKLAVVMMTRTPVGYCAMMYLEWWQPYLKVNGLNTLCVPMLLHFCRASSIDSALHYNQLCLNKCMMDKLHASLQALKHTLKA